MINLKFQIIFFERPRVCKLFVQKICVLSKNIQSEIHSSVHIFRKVCIIITQLRLPIPFTLLIVENIHVKYLMQQRKDHIWDPHQQHHVKQLAGDCVHPGTLWKMCSESQTSRAASFGRESRVWCVVESCEFTCVLSIFYHHIHLSTWL